MLYVLMDFNVAESYLGAKGSLLREQQKKSVSQSKNNRKDVLILPHLRYEQGKKPSYTQINCVTNNPEHAALFGSVSLESRARHIG